MTQQSLFVESPPVELHDCYMATCPLCGGKIGAAVFDVGDIDDLKDAVSYAKQWTRDGYVVTATSVAAVNRISKFGHVGLCVWRPNRRG